MIDKFIVANAENLPFDEQTFDFIVSHGVLDSMPLDVAKNSFIEAHRVLKDEGLFYVDLIAGNGIEFPIEFSGEVVVSGEHEKGTIQLYYNWMLINEVINGRFEIVDAKMVTEQSLIKIKVDKRVSLVLRKI